MIIKWIAPALGLFLLLALQPAAGAAQEAAAEAAASETATEEAPEIGFFHDADLGLVLTEGNSNTESLAVNYRLRRLWPKARYTLRTEAFRSDTASDRFAVLDPDDPEGFLIVQPDSSPDAGRYLIENSYDRKISERLLWNTGLSWDRNEEAGIVNRWVYYLTLGHLWWDREDLRFNTTYGLSYTDREEDTLDPLKDESFAGIRWSWEYLNKWGDATTFTNNWNFNANLSDFDDFTTDMTTALAVSMNAHLALKVSLTWLYNNIPALETIELWTSEDQIVLVGEVEARRKKLDTIFNTSLVLTF